MKRTSAAGILCLAFALSTAASFAELKIKDGEKLTFVGDSITWVGAFKDGYCHLVERSLKRLGLGRISISCRGVSGDTSRGMLKRLPKILAEDKPAWLTFSCGVNDAGLRNFKAGVGGVDEKEFAENIEKFAALCDEAGVKVVVLPPSCAWGENPDNEHLNEYADMMRAMAKRHGYPVADIRAVQTKLLRDPSTPAAYPGAKWKFTYDGTHSTLAGDISFAKTLLATLGATEEEIAAEERRWIAEAGSPKGQGSVLFDKSQILTDKGYPFRSNYYVGGRLSCRYGDFNGLQEVMYFSDRTPQNRYFQADDNNNYFQCFRLDVLVDGKAYKPVFTKTRQYPFGYTSECLVGGVTLYHDFVLDDNVVFRRLRVAWNSEGHKVRARVSHVQWTSTGTENRSDYRRSYLMPDYDRNSLTSSIVRVFNAGRDAKGRPVTTNSVVNTIEIGCSTSPVEFPLNRRDQPPQNDRFWLTETAEAEKLGDHVFYMVFDRRPDEDLSSARIDRLFQRYRLDLGRTARFETGSTAVDQMLESAPQTMKALEFRVPGAFRSGPYYGVWAWDTFVHLDGMCLMGFEKEVKESLHFFNAARGEKGVPFCFSNDLRPSQKPARPEVQLFFVTLLNSYYQLTGDRKTLEEMLPTARKVVEEAKSFLREGDVLMRGNRFYPDQPRRLLMTEDDYALVINSLFYQGLRSWNELTGEDGEFCGKLRDEINRRFWDPEAKFYVDSVAAGTYERRPFYPSYGMFYVSKFGLDPLVAAGNLADTAEYMKTHFWAKYGLRTFELDTRGYQVDGGHCGACRPVASRNYWNVLNRAGRIDALADFRAMVEENWKTFTYPEGQLLEFENEDLVTHNDCPGGKQFFSLKAWVWDVFELWLGLSAGKDGVSFHAINDGRPFKAEKVRLRGRYLKITMTGKGTDATYVFNGKKLEQGFIPWAEINRHVNELVITVK